MIFNFIQITKVAPYTIICVWFKYHKKAKDQLQLTSKGESTFYNLSSSKQCEEIKYFLPSMGYFSFKSLEVIRFKIGM